MPVNGFNPASMAEVLEWRAERHPERLAYTFCDDGETESGSLTFGQLHERARAIAAWLRRAAGPDDRVLLALPSGPDYVASFMGCLYAGTVAVPTYPPSLVRLHDTASRFRAIVRDARPAVALTTQRIIQALGLEGATAVDPAISATRWETVAAAEAGSARQRFAEARIAFLQYTSGSTSTPKGVMVSHDNLIHNELGIQVACEHDETSTFVGWLPLYHDMGLIGNVLHPLYIGARSILMPPSAFLQRPARWLQAISRYRAVTSGGPNFAYELCLRRVDDQELQPLDLSTWSVAFNGAEPVRGRTLDRFAERFAPCGFRRQSFFPCYGLAECTLMVSGGPREKAPTTANVDIEALQKGEVRDAGGEVHGQRMVGCGQAVAGMQIAIVDPKTRARRGEGEIGEMWVAGRSVAMGYWARESESADSFGATIADGGDQHWLRTGDLGYVDRGELFVTSRLKDLIIIRGRNFHPNDIEATVEQCHPSLRPSCGAAFSVDGDDSDELAIVHEIERDAFKETGAVLGAIRTAVSVHHDIQAGVITLVKPGGIPKTTSGKVRRRECRAALLERRLPVVAESAIRHGDVPAGTACGSVGAMLRALPLEERPAAVAALLRRMAARVLRIGVADVNPDIALVLHGLDSVGSTDLICLVERELDLCLAKRTLAGTESLADVTVAVLEALAEIRPAEPDAPMSGELSRGELALWYLHHSEPESPVYNLSGSFHLITAAEKPRLRRALQKLADRHEGLRTTFPSERGEPARRVSSQGSVALEEHDATTWNEQMLRERIRGEAGRPFDIAERPLWRVHLFERSDGDVLQIVVHHLVADFRSLEVLIEELGWFYSSESEEIDVPPGPPYRAWQQRQNLLLASPERERLMAYWRRQLATSSDAAPPVPPRTSKGAGVQRYQTCVEGFEVDPSVHERLRRLARTHGVTLFTLVAAALKVLLHRWSGQSDVRIACPMSCRQDGRFERTIGYFVNTVILRSAITAPLRFADFLRMVGVTVREAQEHVELPLDLLGVPMSTDGPRGTIGLLPLTPVMLVWQRAHLPALEHLALPVARADSRVQIGALEAVPLEVRQAGPPADITVVIGDTPGAMSCSFVARESALDAPTLLRLAARFERLLDRIAIDPEQHVSELACLSSDEEAEEIRAHNATDLVRPAMTLDEAVAEASDRQPDAVILTFNDRHLSFGELNRSANRCARVLRARVHGPNAVVGVHLNRMCELPIVLLAVVKAGCAYLPLDPEYPEERLRYMTRQARASCVITSDSAATELAGVPALGLARLVAEAARCADSNPTAKPSLLDIAYVIFTSGSTGMPKGVMTTHAGVVNRLLWMLEEYRLGGDDVILQKTPMTFDVSVWELFLPLLGSGRMVLATPGGHRDPSYLAEVIEREGVTVVHFVPSMLRAFVAARQADHRRCSSVRRVIASGEALPADLVRQCAESLDATVHNLYGPTEAAIDATSWDCAPDTDGSGVPIGHPIDNTRIYILDRYMSPCPSGAAGELYIGGVGLARGYVGSPALTAERFQPDPFARAGGRLYATGDLARRRADGAVEYVGRIDSQVKIRGFRVELGEVEAALRSVPQIRNCAIVAEADSETGARLVAYLVVDHKPAEVIASARRRLPKKLPDYMVPSAFIAVAHIPVNANGKADHRALRAMDRVPYGDDAEPDTDSTPIEDMLRPLWLKTLGVEHCRRDSNFFTLGGHSLLALRLLAEVRSSLGIEISLTRFLSGEPTLAGMAAMIEELLLASVDEAELTRLLADVPDSLT
jgi:amino acid adenylation domain-containing protein